MEKNNKIYCIRCTDTQNTVYVGKTTQELEDRLWQHRLNHTYPEKVLWLEQHNHEIILLEEYIEDCLVSKQEQYWIDQYATFDKLNRRRAKKKSYSDALKDAKSQIKKMKKDNQ